VKFNFFRAPINEDYDPAKRLPSFETKDQASKRRRLLVSALPELGEAGRALALRLDGCGFIKCGSAGCPVCLRLFRRWWGSTLAEYMARAPDYWFTVSIVPSDLFDVGHLHRFPWKLLKDRLRNQIARSLISETVMLGGIDYKGLAARVQPSHGQLHADLGDCWRRLVHGRQLHLGRGDDDFLVELRKPGAPWLAVLIKAEDKELV
jgi:hypothetical protein